MYWNAEASVALAVIGFSGVLYTAWKREPLVLCITLAYFSLMEGLQAYTYSVLNQCGSPSNELLTVLAYLHICFQPFLINAISLYFIPKRIAKKIAPFAYSACFGVLIMMLIRLYPFTWATHCAPGGVLCADKLCSVSGSWHIAWLLPLNDVAEYIPWFALAAFVMPALYGSWRVTLYHLLAGPLLARLMTSNMNEWPAVWCLLSVVLILILIKTPIQQIMFVRRFWLWHLFKLEG